MCDMGGEFTSLKLTEKFKELGMKIFHSVLHAPQQNGRAECFNRTLFEKAEAMCHMACLPKSWWEFCVEYAVHVYNRMPMQQLKYTSPYELLYGLKPDIVHMHTLGCAAYVFLHEDQCHAELMTFIGYADGIKGWKFMRSTNVIFYATKAVFNESTFLHCPEGLCASIPTIKMGLLPVNEGNIPLEDNDQPLELAPVKGDPVWRPTVSWPYVPPANGDHHQPPPITPPADHGNRQGLNSRGLSSSSSNSNRGNMYQSDPEFWKAPEGVQTPSDRRSRDTTSRNSRQTPEEDWQSCPDHNFKPGGHWEYNLSRIPHRMGPYGPQFLREPFEHEQRWIRSAPPLPMEQHVEEPQPLRFADLWNSPPWFERGGTYSGSSPTLERLQVERQTPA